MPKNVVNAVVIVAKQGRNFPSSIIDEHELTAEFGDLDTQQIKTDQFSQFRYAGGQYEVLVLPDRINIRSVQGREVFPAPLITVAQKIARELEPAKKVLPLAAVGLNCEMTFYQQEVGREGKEWGKKMVAGPITDHLLTGQDFGLKMASASLILRSQHVLYTIRVEPEYATQGRDFFVAVNGHQDLRADDSLVTRLGAVEEVRGVAETFRQQVLSLKENIQ